MNTHEILDKIKKLLRLGQSPNPHEAELAVQRAFELAARHQIDIENISLDDDVRKTISEKFPSPGRLSFARKKLLNLLPAFFNVNVVIQGVPAWLRSPSRQPQVVFIGTSIDIQIAKYVYDFLHTACSAALKEFCAEKCGLNAKGRLRRRPAASTQKQFVSGFVYGISTTLRQAKASLSEQQNGLILSEAGRRDQFEKQMFSPGSLKPVKFDHGRRNDSAVHAGFIEGQKIEIRKPLETKTAGQLLIGI